MIIEISIAIIACAFVALVIYLILVLRSANDTLRQANRTITTLNKQLESLNSICSVVSLIGNKAEESTKEYLNRSCLPEGSHCTDPMTDAASPSNKFVDIMEWLALGLTLWRRNKNRS